MIDDGGGDAAFLLVGCCSWWGHCWCLVVGVVVGFAHCSYWRFVVAVVVNVDVAVGVVGVRGF